MEKVSWSFLLSSNLNKISIVRYQLCFLLIYSGIIKGQLYTNLGEQHNQIFMGAGYSDSFSNIHYGINHVHYLKIIKRDLIGILDFSTPLSHKYFTRFIFRKGFQLDLYKKKDFKLPISIITSSVKKHLYLFSFHDIVTDFSLMPGKYTGKYSIAAEVSIKYIWFRKAHLTPEYYQQSYINSNIGRHKVNVSAGLILAYNIKRFSFIYRIGFQEISDWEFTKNPIYAVGILAYKLNFKKT